MKAYVLRIVLFLSLVMVGLGSGAASKAQSARPDLDIMFASFSNYTTYANLNGHQVPISWSSANVQVQNRGTASSPACSMRMNCWRLDDTFRVGNPEKSFVVNVPALAAGQTTTVNVIQFRSQFDFLTEFRNLTFFDLLIDCGFQVIESNEANNTHTVWGEINQ